MTENRYKLRTADHQKAKSLLDEFQAAGRLEVKVVLTVRNAYGIQVNDETVLDELRTRLPGSTVTRDQQFHRD